MIATIEGTPKERIAAFDSEAGISSMLILPLLVGAFVAVISPWLKYMFAALSAKPVGLFDSTQLEMESKRLQIKAEIERRSATITAEREKELIERAQRDTKISEIASQEAQKKLKNEIESVRAVRDLPTAAKELLAAASRAKNGQIIKLRTMGGTSISAGNEIFGKQGAKTLAKYVEGLSKLIETKLVVAVGDKDEVFELTHEGWQYAELL